MKITILTLTFPPEPAQHILDLAVGLVAKGHGVTVVTSLPSYPTGKVYGPYRNRLVAIENIQGVKIVRLPVFPSHARSLLKRAAYYLSNALATIIYSLFTLFVRNDVIVVYHPPLTTALSALMTRSLRRSRFVHWIHDMWPETLEAGGVQNKFVLRCIDRLAKFIYSRASKIMVLSDGFKRNLIEKGVPPDKICAVPNWANSETVAVRQACVADYAKAGLVSGKFHVLYAGNLGEMQALESLVDAMDVLKNEPDVVLLFLGTGTQESFLRQYASERKLEERVKFLGRVTPVEVGFYYSLADALLVHIKDTKLFQITIPHKIYEYMLAAKPIVAAIKGEAAAEISMARAGVVCEPENPLSIAQAIKSVKALSGAERSSMGENGRQFVLKERSPGALIDRIEGVLVEAAGPA